MTRPQPKGGAGRVSPDSNPNRRRTIFLSVDGNGHFAPARDPTAFMVTAASGDAAAGGELGGASAHLVPPAPPVIELSNEMGFLLKMNQKGATSPRKQGDGLR